jgi:hypothetical protein
MVDVQHVEGVYMPREITENGQSKVDEQV